MVEEYRRKRMKKSIVILAMALAGSLLAFAEPTVLKVDKIGLGNVTDDRIAKEIDKALLAKYNIKVEWVPIGWDETATKPSLQLMSGNAPDIVWTDKPNTNYLKWVKANLLAPWTDQMFKAAPIASQLMHDPAFANAKVKGKYYMLPQLGDPFSFKPERSMYIRADWLRKLGLKAPTTLDEMLEVAKAFTTKDPDGNGKNDTWGIGAFGKQSGGTIGWAVGIQQMNGYLLPAFGSMGPDEFVMKGGQPVLCGIQPEMKQIIAFYNKVYAAGVIDPEAINQGSATDLQNRFVAGKVGIIFDNGGLLDRIAGLIAPVDPAAEVSEIMALKGPAGIKTRLTNSFWGALVISSKCKDPVAAAKFIEYTLSEEFWKLTTMGIESEHYSVDAKKPGEFIIAPFMEQRKKDKLALANKPINMYELGWGIGNWGAPPESYRDYIYSLGAAKKEVFLSERALYQQFNLQDPAKVVVDPTAGTVSESWEGYKNKLGELFTKYIPNMVRGTIALDAGWNDMLKEFKDIGGEEAVKKYLDDWKNN
jgi:ABC-type glycerol-3-phosphate transport system substrate-binding protein